MAWEKKNPISEEVAGTITLGDIECFAGDTMIRIPFTTFGSTPVEIRAGTYNSTGQQPAYEDVSTQSTTSPIELPYDPASCDDRVVVYAAFASGAASGDIPCVGSGCSSSGSMPAAFEAGANDSVLP